MIHNFEEHQRARDRKGKGSVLCVPGILDQQAHPMYEQVIDACELVKTPYLDRLVFARDILQFRAWARDREEILCRYASELADLRDIQPGSPAHKAYFLANWAEQRSLEFVYRVAELFPESMGS